MKEEFKFLLEEYQKVDGDDVGLWEVISSIEKKFSIHDAESVMELTLEFVAILLSNGFRAINGRYVPWENQNVDYVINRIRSEWSALGREPNIGDIVYFDFKP